MLTAESPKSSNLHFYYNGHLLSLIVQKSPFVSLQHINRLGNILWNIGVHNRRIGSKTVIEQSLIYHRRGDFREERKKSMLATFIPYEVTIMRGISITICSPGTPMRVTLRFPLLLG